MHLLTDCPEEIVLPAPLAAQWQSDPPDSAQQALWRALGDHGPLRHARLAGVEELPGLHALAVIRRADASQFDALLDALKQHAPLPPGCAAIALEGRKFHGHRGRSWAAVRGNIHLSVYYPYAAEAREAGAGLTMLPAVAVVDTIRALYPENPAPGIKWVNDILVEGRKVSGVITSTRLTGSRIEQVVFGIGLNVDSAPELAPCGFVHAAGALNAAYAPQRHSLWAVLFELLHQLDRRFAQMSVGGREAIFRAYCEHACIVGRQVRIYEEGGSDHPDALGQRNLLAEGVVEAINPDLTLALRGQANPVTRGRLAFSPPA